MYMYVYIYIYMRGDRRVERRGVDEAARLAGADLRSALLHIIILHTMTYYHTTL